MPKDIPHAVYGEEQFKMLLTVSFLSGQAFLEAKKQFDLVFLDIQMEGMDGMDTARVFRKMQPEAILIFVTGSKEYVFEHLTGIPFHPQRHRRRYRS